MNHCAIDVRNLSFSYGNHAILKRLVFSCTKGTFTTILGPNGSGKTTLLRLISGWLKTVPGTIFINGNDIGEMKEPRRAKQIASLRQDHTGGFDFTVYDLVLLGRSPYIPYLSGVTETDRREVERALAQTGIGDFRDRLISTLSGGELQRVYIAQALAQNADILLLDEPITHLDIKYQIEILALIKKLQEENGITVLAVLHDLNCAALFSDRILLLEKGTLAADGSPAITLTEENIVRVFDVAVRIQPDPQTGVPQIFIACDKEKKYP